MGVTTVLCDKRHSKTSLLGSDVELRCSSSFSPVWFWSDGKRGGIKTLSRDGKNPHPNLDDDRFQFEAGKDVFWLKIKSVRNSDAGKYVCDGNPMKEFLLGVVRYVVLLFYLTRTLSTNASVITVLFDPLSNNA